MNISGLGQCSFDHLFIVDSFPAVDTKKEVIEWMACGGGPVATALVSLKRLGHDCSFCGITGDDESGGKIRDSLKNEGVNVTGLIKRKGALSQTAFICVDKGSGKRTIFWKRPTGEALRPDEIPGNFLDNADLLLLDGLMKEASISAAKRAKDKGIPVMLDAGRVREGMLELAGMCDYIVASEEFGRGLLGRNNTFDPGKALLKMKAFGAKAATITLGDRGSMTIAGEEMFHTPAFSVDVLDTTGAGDVFHGGYIHGLLRKQEIKEVVRFASAFAALKCRKLGGREGIPTLKQVEQLLNK
ncbi:MAG TPA: sugar kinase [Nitrospirae bacterium]|nr:sugar kinase [Nitrospirota bacterium]